MNNIEKIKDKIDDNIINNPSFMEIVDTPFDDIIISNDGKTINLITKMEIFDRDKYSLITDIEIKINNNRNLQVIKFFGKIIDGNYFYKKNGLKNKSILYKEYICSIYDKEGIELYRASYSDGPWEIEINYQDEKNIREEITSLGYQKPNIWHNSGPELPECSSNSEVSVTNRSDLPGIAMISNYKQKIGSKTLDCVESSLAAINEERPETLQIDDWDKFAVKVDGKYIKTQLFNGIDSYKYKTVKEIRDEIIARQQKVLDHSKTKMYKEGNSNLTMIYETLQRRLNEYNN